MGAGCPSRRGPRARLNMLDQLASRSFGWPSQAGACFAPTPRERAPVPRTGVCQITRAARTVRTTTAGGLGRGLTQAPEGGSCPTRGRRRVRIVSLPRGDPGGPDPLLHHRPSLPLEPPQRDHPPLAAGDALAPLDQPAGLGLVDEAVPGCRGSSGWRSAGSVLARRSLTGPQGPRLLMPAPRAHHAPGRTRVRLFAGDPWPGLMAGIARWTPMSRSSSGQGSHSSRISRERQDRATSPCLRDRSAALRNPWRSD